MITFAARVGQFAQPTKKEGAGLHLLWKQADQSSDFQEATRWQLLQHSHLRLDSLQADAWQPLGKHCLEKMTVIHRFIPVKVLYLNLKVICHLLLPTQWKRVARTHHGSRYRRLRGFIVFILIIICNIVLFSYSLSIPSRSNFFHPKSSSSLRA